MEYYHNPRCSKSRQGLDYLSAKGVQPTIRDYLSTGLTLDEIQLLSASLGLPVSGFVRKKDLSGLGLAVPSTESEWTETLLAHPKLLERPIAVSGTRAVIGRPTEQLDTLL